MLGLRQPEQSQGLSWVAPTRVGWAMSTPEIAQQCPNLHPRSQTWEHRGQWPKGGHVFLSHAPVYPGPWQHLWEGLVVRESAVPCIWHEPTVSP